MFERGFLYEAMYFRVSYNTWTVVLARCRRVRTMARRWSEKVVVKVVVVR